jgi:hypothetical protein
MPWGDARHPLLDQYKSATLAARHPNTIPEIGLADAKAIARRAWQDFGWHKEHREQVGLRRVVDAWARWYAAEQHASKIEQQNPQDRTRIIKNFARRKSSVRSVPWRDE